MKARVVAENFWSDEINNYSEVFYVQFKWFIFWHYMRIDRDEIPAIPYGADPIIRPKKVFRTFNEAVEAIHNFVKATPHTFKKYYNVYIPKH